MHLFNDDGELIAPNFRHRLRQDSPTWALEPILAGLRGSHAHGTTLASGSEYDTDDIDVFSVVVREPFFYLTPLSLGSLKAGRAWQTNGETLDIEGHELLRFVHLLMKGNPNGLQALHLDPLAYGTVTRAGKYLIQHRKLFITRRVVNAFRGYAREQISKMYSLRKQGYMGDDRTKLAQRHGYDIKNAAHVIRLLSNCLAYVRVGEIQPRLTGRVLNDVMMIKQGEVGLSGVTEMAKMFESQIDEALADRGSAYHAMPEQVDAAAVNACAYNVMKLAWEEQGVKV